MTESDRIAAVEAELERMRAKEHEDERAREHLAAPPALPLSALGKELMARQDAARQERRAAHQAQDRAYQAQLAKNAPEREQLRARLRDVDTEFAAEQARHATAEAKISADRQAISRKLSKLEQLPPMPTIAPVGLPPMRTLDQVLGAPQPPPRDRVARRIGA